MLAIAIKNSGIFYMKLLIYKEEDLLMFLKKIFIIVVLFVYLTLIAEAQTNKITEWKKGKEYTLKNAIVIIGRDIWLDCKASGTDIVKGEIVLEKVLTDGKGNYVTNLPAGTYDVIVWKKGYTPQIDKDVSIPGYSTCIAYDTSMQGLHRELVYETKKVSESVSIAGIVYLSDLTPSSPVTWNICSGRFTLEEDIFIGKYPIKLGGIEYKKGLHTHAPARITYLLKDKYTTFESYIGLWDSGNPARGITNDVAGKKGSVVFQVFLDGVKKFDSGIMYWNDTKNISIPVDGATQIDLVVTEGGDGGGWDWAVWGNSRLIK
jgi:hypothetical protein